MDGSGSREGRPAADAEASARMEATLLRWDAAIRRSAAVAERAEAARERAEAARERAEVVRRKVSHALAHLADPDRSADDEREPLAGEQQRMAEERERIANEREAQADERERLANERDAEADERERLANEREHLADVREGDAEATRVVAEEQRAESEVRGQLLARRRTEGEQREHDVREREERIREREALLDERERVMDERELAQETGWPPAAPSESSVGGGSTTVALSSLRERTALLRLRAAELADQMASEAEATAADIAHSVTRDDSDRRLEIAATELEIARIAREHAARLRGKDTGEEQEHFPALPRLPDHPQRR